MQWDASQNAGFTKGTPWYALNPNYKEINAEDALKDKESVFYHYQKLIQLRHQTDVIKYGTFEELDPKDDQVYAYRRHYEGKTLLIMSNFTDQTVTRDYDQQKAAKMLISNYDDDQGTTLRPYESKVYLFA
jgi:oligo-1,6-glucosidase